MHFLKEQKRKGKEEDETEGQGESFEHWETITWGGGGSLWHQKCKSFLGGLLVLSDLLLYSRQQTLFIVNKLHLWGIEPGAYPIKILQRKFYALLIFKHPDWLINLSSQSECLKN